MDATEFLSLVVQFFDKSQSSMWPGIIMMQYDALPIDHIWPLFFGLLSLNHPIADSTSAN